MPWEKYAITAFLFGLALGPGAVASVPTTNRAQFALWAKIKRPLDGPESPYGSYAAGCLGGAKTLPLDGPGFAVMRPTRQRYYGHSQMLEYIRELGAKLKAEKLPLLLVGDIGRARGGPMQTGHASHQVGLDVDLWYRMSKSKPTKRQRETWGADSFVVNGTQLSPHWNDSHRKLLAAAAQSPLVSRIFVHPVIKRDLCQKFAGAPWLYKYRAWWSHHDHLHVRLNCPEGSAHCQPQMPALEPAKDQCGEELAWWFSEEAKQEGEKKSAAFAEREFPILPSECGKMVSDLRTEKK